MEIQNPSYFKRQVLDSDRTAYYFDGTTGYNRFIAEVEANALADNTSVARRGFEMVNDRNYAQGIINTYGTDKYGTTDASLVTSPITGYLFNNELDTFVQNVRDRTVTVDKVDIDQVKSIKFTEMEIGIFSFDLASLGLIPVMEYYSPLLKKIVSGNFVYAYKDSNNVPLKDDNGKTMFYHVFVPKVPTHSVEFDGGKNGYYSEILNRVLEKSDLFFDDKTNKFYYLETQEIIQHDVQQKQKLDANGKLKWTTTWKKSFIHIPRVSKPLPRVDIIVASSFGWNIDATTEMIYSSMAAIALAEKLSKSNVNYRIIVAYPLSTSGPGSTKEIYSYVVAKKDGEALDKNKIAVLMSDGRQFRYNQFKGFYATQYDAGFDSRISVTGIGSPINDSLFIDKQYPTEGNGDKYIIRDLSSLTQSRRYNEEYDTPQDAVEDVKANGWAVDRTKIAYMDYLANSINPNDIMASKNWDSKILFSGALTEQDAVNQYESAITKISNLT
jgi:hypothetical protein